MHRSTSILALLEKRERLLHAIKKKWRKNTTESITHPCAFCLELDESNSEIIDDKFGCDVCLCPLALCGGDEQSLIDMLMFDKKYRHLVKIAQIPNDIIEIGQGAIDHELFKIKLWMKKLKICENCAEWQESELAGAGRCFRCYRHMYSYERCSEFKENIQKVKELCQTEKKIPIVKSKPFVPLK